MNLDFNHYGLIELKGYRTLALIGVFKSVCVITCNKYVCNSVSHVKVLNLPVNSPHQIWINH